MNGEPQETRNEEQEDLLEQIITQGLDQMNAPAQEEAGEEAPTSETPSAPQQEDSGNTAPPADKKNRRSAVYLYLLILFGAAFFLLLLAYFIQQRSNETTISDLRESMTLSRDELLAEIKELEEKNAALEEKNNLLDEEVDHYKGESEQWRTYYYEKEQEADDLQNQYNTALTQLSGWKKFWALEQSYQAGKYEDCVAILILEHMTEYDSTVPPETSDRYVEIIQALADRGLIPKDQPINISDYQELIDRFLAELPEYYGPTGWANVTYD